MNINKLPSTLVVRAMSADDVARKVIELVDLGNNISGEAVFDINRFLADAAVKLAKDKIGLHDRLPVAQQHAERVDNILNTKSDNGNKLN